MFILSVVEDNIKVSPEQFGRDLTEVIIEQLEIKYLNKVLLDCGLCVSVYDILDAKDPIVHPAEGCCHQQITFRLVVFKPFVGEVLIGKLIESMEQGIKLSVKFFDDIFVPSYLLPKPSQFDPTTSTWIWKFNKGESVEEDFILEPESKVRFRVRKIEFTGLSPTVKGVEATVMSESRSSFPVTTSSAIPGQSSSHVSLVASGNAVSTSSSAGAVSSASASASAPLGATVDESAPHLTRRRSSSVGQHPEDAYPPPMTITGSINEDGLGAVSWWDGSDGDRDEEVAPEESMIES